MVKKLKYIFLLGILVMLGLSTNSQARITTSDPTVESGGTATITISSQEAVAYGSIDVTSTGGLTFVSVSGGTANGTLVASARTENKKSGIATYKFKVPNVSKTTTYKVVFSSADMGTAEGESIDSSTATATVTVRAAGNNSGSGNSSSGSGSSSSGNSGSSGSNNQPTAPSFSSRNEKVYATSSVNVRASYSTSSSVIGSLDAGDSVTRTGVATTSVNGITWSRVTYNGQTAYISSSYLTTEEPEEEKSNNKNLKSLAVDGYEITPEFSSDVTEYDLTVDENVDALTVNAVAEDENAKIEITGNDNLLIGENTIEIKVTAEDETVRTYKINVTKGETVGIQLSELNVEGYTLDPEFNSDIYEYTLNINDTSITSINIDAKSNTENAVIEIAGNNELKLGENLVTILVKSEDEQDIATYQIIVNIQEKPQEQIIAGIDNNDLYLYGGIGLGVLVIIIIIIIIIVKRRHRDDDDFSTYYGGFNSLDDENTDKKDNSESKLDNGDIEKISEKKDEMKSRKKDIIEENFGTDISSQEFTEDDKSKRRRGKHF